MGKSYLLPPPRREGLPFLPPTRGEGLPIVSLVGKIVLLPILFPGIDILDHFRDLLP